MTTQDPRKFILMGRFGAPHGVRGEIRLQSFTAYTQDILTYDALTDKTGARDIKLLSAYAQGKDMLIVRVEGINNRDAAQALTGLELYLPRKNLPPTQEDEFYLADLIGLKAETSTGVLLGSVYALRNFGAGDIIEIKPVDGSDTLMFPFTKIVAPIIDFETGRIVIEPPIETGNEHED